MSIRSVSEFVYGTQDWIHSGDLHDGVIVKVRVNGGDEGGEGSAVLEVLVEVRDLVEIVERAKVIESFNLEKRNVGEGKKWHNSTTGSVFFLDCSHTFGPYSFTRPVIHVISSPPSFANSPPPFWSPSLLPSPPSPSPRSPS